ncbi:MAG: FeoA family protein [Candidatus Helarchaeota archaeon]
MTLQNKKRKLREECCIKSFESSKSTNSGNKILVQCLTECKKMCKLKVISINAGFKAKKRLGDLGILPGTIIVKKKDAPFRGPVEIIVKGSSLVLGRGLAKKILVRCISS